MNTRTRILAVLLTAMLLILAGCSGETKSAQKPGVVYLDPNAAPISTSAAAPASTQAPVSVSDSPGEVQTAEGEDEPEAPLDLYFECRGVRIEPMMEAATVLAALGEPIRRVEADSCAYVGTKDIFYSYPGVQLTVNEVEGVERITVIFIEDDTVTIPQGLRIYDEEEKLLSVLGGTEENGIYVYHSGQTELLIQVKEAENDSRRIAFIEYRVAEEQ